jgi:uncharacterized membrane protein
MARVVLGVFEDKLNADDALSHLEREGFDTKDISIIMRDSDGEVSGRGSNVLGGAVGGATTGGVLGGLAGLLIGVGAIAVPGIGALLIGGPIAAAIGLTGAAATTVSGAVTGALAGGLVGSLVGLGIPEEDARLYEERIKSGAILLAVPTSENKEDLVMDIMDRYGADQIKSVVFTSNIGRDKDIRDADRDYDYPRSYASDVSRKSKR